MDYNSGAELLGLATGGLRLQLGGDKAHQQFKLREGHYRRAYFGG